MGQHLLLEMYGIGDGQPQMHQAPLPFTGPGEKLEWATDEDCGQGLERWEKLKIIQSLRWTNLSNKNWKRGTRLCLLY